MSNNNSKDFFNQHKKVIVTSSIAIVAVAVAVGGYIASVNKNVNSWENKIYPGVHAYGVDLGGKTKEEAVEILNNDLTNLVNNKNINITVGEKSFEIRYADIGSTINADKTAEEALAYGKQESMFTKNSMIKGKKDSEVETELAYDEAKLKEFEEKVNSEVEIPAVDASISINYGEISVTPEVIGKKVDSEELHTKLVASINPDPEKNEVVTVELKEYTPKVTAADLNKITGRIAGFSDGYANTGDGRVINMEIATGYINGTLLMPGDEFRYNETIKDTTPENGYHIANTYVGSEVVPGYGGGVCQISTYLYRAAMNANLRSTIRYNHSMMVGYSTPSLDATVAEGDIDYRFINTYDFPIYIEGYMSGSAITFNIYGNVEAMGNKSYQLVGSVIEKYDFETEYIDDPNMPEGTQKVKLNGAPGYKSQGYLVTYEDGVEVNRELVSTDVYQPMNTIIQRGTKKPEPKPEEPKPEQPKPEEDKPAENKPSETPGE